MGAKRVETGPVVMNAGIVDLSTRANARRGERLDHPIHVRRALVRGTIALQYTT